MVGNDIIQREVLRKTKESMEGFIPTISGNSDAYNTPFISHIH